jgi:peptidoglycan/LPS O-acetylase OafA/YrhL
MSENLAQERKNGFRPEIEGLRTLAALLVAVYHIFIGRVSGGVDVFFVVSGFLVTTSLLSQTRKFGRPQFLTYFGNLISRLLPLTIFVVVAILTLLYFTTDQARISEPLRDAAASLLYFENWRLVSLAADYNADQEYVSSFQHFWAMSIQGQFYVLLFVLIAVGHWLFKKSFKSLVGLVAVVTLASFAYSIWLTSSNQAVAYFHTGARFWEFLVGTLLALVVPNLKLTDTAKSRLTGNLLANVALFALVLMGMLLDVSRQFPGWIALVPVVAATAVIVAGNLSPANEKSFGFLWLLRTRPMVWTGQFAFGIYLWHWPLLIWAQNSSNQSAVSLQTGLAILISATLLSVITTKLIESPLRKAPGHMHRWIRIVQVALVAAIAMSSLQTAIAIENRVEQQIQEQIQIQLKDGQNPFYPNAKRINPNRKPLSIDELAGRYIVPSSRKLIPSTSLAVNDKGIAYTKAAGCVGQADVEEVKVCKFGPSKARKSVMVVGGSHAAQYIESVLNAFKAPNWKVITVVRVACRLQDYSLEDTPPAFESCAQWSRNAIEKVKELRPTVLLVMGTVTSLNRPEKVPVGFKSVVQELSPYTRSIIGMRDNPRFLVSVPNCIDSTLKWKSDCVFPRTDFKAQMPAPPFEDAPANYRLVDLIPYICSSTECAPTLGKYIKYRDTDHLTGTFATILAPVLAYEVKQAFPRLPL